VKHPSKNTTTPISFGYVHSRKISYIEKIANSKHDAPEKPTPSFLLKQMHTRAAELTHQDYCLEVLPATPSPEFWHSHSSCRSRIGIQSVIQTQISHVHKKWRVVDLSLEYK
jgi:hypothetical protein